MDDDGLRARGSSRLGAAVALLALVLFCSGGKLVEISDIPPPFDEDIVFGKVLTEIRIEGHKDTKEKWIRAAMKSQVGERYTLETATLDYRWLTQLAVFTSVRFETIPDGEGVILLVQMTEVNKYVPAPVIRITDENGLSLGLRITSNNVLGAAAKASAYFTVGGTTNFGLRFKDPWIPGRSWLFGYTFKYEHAERRNEIFDFDERSDDVFTELRRNITDEVRLGAQLTYLGVRGDPGDVNLSPEGTDHIPGVGLSFQTDTRNLPIYPTQGWWIEFGARKYGFGGEETDYWQADLDLRRYLELGRPERSLALYSLATLTSGEVGVDVPIYMQFALGGANSIRGWDLGSRVGKNQFINTAEYWHLLLDHKKVKFWFFRMALGLQLGVFGDAGTAWSDGEQFYDNWIGGGGAGLRLLIPYTVMFRVDVAAGEEGAGLTFALGTWEKAVAQRDRVR